MNIANLGLKIIVPKLFVYSSYKGTGITKHFNPGNFLNNESNNDGVLHFCGTDRQKDEQ